MAHAIISSSAITEQTLEGEKTLEEELCLPILMADRIINLAKEANLSRQDCADLSRQVERISTMLRTYVRLTSVASSSVYDRPARRVARDIVKHLERASALVRRCRGSIFRHVLSITSTADFRKVSSHLESSIGDMRWLLSILDGDDGEDGGGANLSLPPIATNLPILAWVWSYLSTIHRAHDLQDRANAANGLASLARDTDRNKQIIVEEGGIPPLLKLLKESRSPDAQIAASNALFSICNNREHVRLIVNFLGVPVVVGVLTESSMRVQIEAANLVTRMADLDDVAQEELVRENVTRPLISLISVNLAFDFGKPPPSSQSIPSIVRMNKEFPVNSLINSHKNGRVGSNLSNHSSFSDGSGRKEKDSENPEIKQKLQISSAKALSKLVKGSLSACTKITETKGLLCLAKIVEKEEGDLQFHSLTALLEITAVAESNTGLRRAAFKTNSPAAKLVLDQLLRIIQEGSSLASQIASIKAIGCLARTFPARETRVLGPLVKHLSNQNIDVAIEAAIALGKFVNADNFNREEHSKAIIEFEGVKALMRLIRVSEKAKVHGLVLLCFIAVNAGNAKALEQAQALNAIEGAFRTVVSQHPELRNQFTKAIHHLTLFQAGVHPHRQSLV